MESRMSLQASASGDGRALIGRSCVRTSRVLTFCASMLTLVLMSCGVNRRAVSLAPADVIPAETVEIARARQALLVVSERAPRERFATAWLLRRESGEAWSVVRGPLRASVGARGVAPAGLKREGDRRTPSGVFTLTEALGREPNPDSGLPYRLATDDDAWDERPDSPTYNQWVRGKAAHGITGRLADDPLLRLCVVVDYNRFPVVPGMGSAIFVHEADPDGAGTFGCIGFRRDELEWLISTLDPRRAPVIVIRRLEDISAH